MLPRGIERSPALFPSLASLAASALRVVRRVRPTYYFIAHNRNHVRIMCPAAVRLRREGMPVQFVDLEAVYQTEGARDELTQLGWQSIPLDESLRRITPADSVIVANDWGPAILTQALVSLRDKGVTLWGQIEGCRFAEPHRYQLVDRILGWGPSCQTHFSQPVDVVGSPAIEAAWQTQPKFEAPPVAVINYKFTYGLTAGREAWIAAVLSACQKVGLRCLISRHPADRQVVADLPLADEEFRDLIPRAALLITRPSTVVYESLAAGKPVVLFPTGGEWLGEFAESEGAFTVAPSAEALPDLIRQALANPLGTRDRSQAFMERHISIDPRHCATERICGALLRSRSR